MENSFKIVTFTLIFGTVFHLTTSTPFSPVPVAPYVRFASAVCLERYAVIGEVCGAIVSRYDNDVKVRISGETCCEILRKVTCMVTKSKADGQCSAELLPHFYNFRSQVVTQLSCTEEQCAKEKTCNTRYGDIGQACGATVTRTQQGVQVFPGDRCCEGYRKVECMQTQANADSQCSHHLLPLISRLLGKFLCNRAECEATTKQPDNGHNASRGASMPLLTTIIFGSILASSQWLV